MSMIAGCDLTFHLSTGPILAFKTTRDSAHRYIDKEIEFGQQLCKAEMKSVWQPLDVGRVVVAAATDYNKLKQKEIRFNL
jgi:hypothetical protein